jgi:quercetin dioxygenase-like cupin family protein
MAPMTKTLELPDGATVEYLTPLADGVPCVLRGTIPPGGTVPLHSHEDTETFLVTGGEIEGFGRDGWFTLCAGDVHHVPGHVKHAWRNLGGEPAVMFLVTTATIGRFFEEVSGVSPEEFLAISDRYGYWNATPEENAEIGITAPAPAHP